MLMSLALPIKKPREKVHVKTGPCTVAGGCYTDTLVSLPVETIILSAGFDCSYVACKPIFPVLQKGV